MHLTREPERNDNVRKERRKIVEKISKTICNATESRKKDQGSRRFILRWLLRKDIERDNTRNVTDNRIDVTYRKRYNNRVNRIYLICLGTYKAEKRRTNENTLRNIDGRWIRDSHVGAMG